MARGVLLGLSLWAAMTLAACGSPTRPTPPPPPPPPPPIGPTLICPLNSTAESPDGNPIAVPYTAPAPVGGTAPVAVACAPGPGSAFPVGVSTVNCTATDSLNLSGTCSFSVSVTRRPPAPRLRLTRFLAFGDSLTEGTVSLGPPYYFLIGTPQSYPAKLQGLLTGRYTDQTIIVINEGRAGEWAIDRPGAPGGVSRLPDVLDTAHPDVVLLMDAANDLLNRKEPAIGPAIGAIEKMVKASRNAGAVVFLATLPPQRQGGQRAGGFSSLPEFNRQIAHIAADEGAVLVDLYTLLAPEIATVVGADGLHLTEAGYARTAELFFEAIKARLEVSTTLSTAAFLGRN